MIAVLLLALPVGLFIGAVGIGGVLMPPALNWLGGLDVHTAAGTSSYSFLFTGLVGTVMYARKKAMPWRFAGTLACGAAPAAVAGALVNGLLSASVLRLVLALMTAGVGVYNLWFRSRGGAGRTRLPVAAAVAVGAVVGFGSALTGTGGPVLLVPVLLALGVQPLVTVAASQLIQLPLVGFATFGYAAQHAVRFDLGTLLGVLAGAGVVVGAWLVLRLPQRRLHQVASAALVGFGAVLLALVFLPTSPA